MLAEDLRGDETGGPFTDLSAKGRPELLRFELKRSLLTPALIEPSLLDAMAAAILEIGNEWTWL